MLYCFHWYFAGRIQETVIFGKKNGMFTIFMITEQKNRNKRITPKNHDTNSADVLLNLDQKHCSSGLSKFGKMM